MGRDSALIDLRRAVDDAVAGRGRLVLIAGEAGIGKTTVAAECGGYAAGRGADVLWATCWDGDGAPAYWPWVQILRAYEAGDGQSLTYGSAAGEVARMMPEAGASANRGSPVLGDDTQERFRLFDGVTSLLIGAARIRPLLVVLDDLQWADVPSLLLLNFLARQSVTVPLLVVGAFRDDEVTVDDTRRRLLAQARGSGELISLAGLTPTDVERMMGSVAGIRPHAALAADVFHRTGGNPFFVREVTQLLASRGDLADSRTALGGIPDGVRQVLAQRLARLSQSCVSILTIAAVVGPETSGDVLGRVAGGGIDMVAERLDEAVRTRVLVAPRGPAGPYRFTHDLFRETLYDDLAPGVRAHLHLRIARALAQSQAAGAVVHAAELAQHLLLAAVGQPDQPGLAAEAVRYGVLAAQEAVARLAYEDAVAHIRRQLDGLDPAGLLGESDRLELLLCRADALRCAGEATAARADYEQAIELARRSPLPTHLGRAALGVHALGVESGASRADCVELLDEALDRLSEQDSALKARVLACLARELFLSGVDERTRAAWLSTAAVQIARRVGDDATLAVCLLASHDTIWLPGTAERRRAIAAEMAAVARRAGDRAFEAEACLLGASSALELGDPGAPGELEVFARLGMAVGQPRYTYLAITRRATLAIMAGRFAEADRLIAEAAVLAESIGEPDAWNVQTRQLWRLRTSQGRRAEVETQFRNLRVSQLRYWYGALLGLILLERGEKTEALRNIGPALLTRPEQLAFSYVLMVQWADLGEAAAATGQLEACQRFYDAMRPYGGTAAVSAAAVGFDGAVDHHLGVLAAALGRVDQAVGHLENALVMHERLCAWPWLAQTKYELAAVLAARGRPADRDRVTALLDDARQAADDFDLARLRRQINEIRRPPPNVFRREGDGWHISFAGQEIRLRDAKGLADIATLVLVPGQTVPAMTLAVGSSPTGLASTGVSRTGVSRTGVSTADLESAHQPDVSNSAGFQGDPILDQQAQRAYRQRLADLDDDIDEAKAQHDLARASSLNDERAFLIRELAAAVGLGHRDRRLGDDRERARKAVGGRIKDALQRIDAVHPALGAHLREAISTGTLCSYSPDQPTRWQS